MHRASIIAVLLCCLTPLRSATLERLTLEEVIQKSTEIVRGRILGSQVGRRGAVIYTNSTVQVVERWKGAPAGQVQVVVPGGTLAGLRQTFSGTPDLSSGGEYLLFLWTGRSGVTQLIGLSQGVFEMKLDQKGEAVVTRPASTETVVDPKTGQPVTDESIVMPFKEMKALIERTLAVSGTQAGR